MDLMKRIRESSLFVPVEKRLRVDEGPVLIPDINAADAVRIVGVESLEEFDAAQKDPQAGVAPECTHHFFPSEVISGFTEVRIRIYYYPGTMDIHIHVEGSGGDTEALSNMVRAGLPTLQGVIAPFTPLDEQRFREVLSENAGRTFGEKEGTVDGYDIHSYQLASCKEGQAYWYRVEYLMHWFIETQNTIDCSDPKWRIYTISQNKQLKGASSVYEFAALPRMRHRVSQFMILPHCRRSGLGRRLYGVVHETIVANSEVMEITAEDPAEGFQRMRDIALLLHGIKIGKWSASNLLGEAPAESHHRKVLALDMKIPIMQALRLNIIVQTASVLTDDELSLEMAETEKLKEVRLLFKKCENATLSKMIELEDRKKVLKVSWLDELEVSIEMIKKMRQLLRAEAS